MNQKRDPIGVLDSGVGGISTLREMVRELPDERFIYYGDMANAPYGTKSTEEVIGCVRNVVDKLTEQHIKALVIACNTATGAAAAVLREELTIPVVGMEPALKPAARMRKNGSVLVLATPLTLHQEKFENLSDAYSHLYMAIGGRVKAVIMIDDPVKKEAGEVVKTLQSLGLKVVMLTGDSSSVAKRVAREIGVDEVKVQVLPEDKAKAEALPRSSAYSLRLAAAPLPP